MGKAGTLFCFLLRALPVREECQWGAKRLGSDEVLLNTPDLKPITASVDKTTQALAWILVWAGPLKKFPVKMTAPFINNSHQPLQFNGHLSGPCRTQSSMGLVTAGGNHCIGMQCILSDVGSALVWTPTLLPRRINTELLTETPLSMQCFHCTLALCFCSRHTNGYSTHSTEPAHKDFSRRSLDGAQF